MDEVTMNEDMTPGEQPAQPVRYVTFQPDGTLDGCYLQVPPDEHIDRMVVVDDDTAAAWVNYHANEARDGVELAPLAQPAVDLDAMRAGSMAKTYADVDAVTVAAVGSRAEEYRDAEAAARAFADAGYQGAADESVSSYAQYNPTGEGQSNAWAADQIIARADAFRGAQKAMRSRRFASQSEIRLAETPEDLAATMDAWDGFIASICSELGL